MVITREDNNSILYANVLSVDEYESLLRLVVDKKDEFASSKTKSEDLAIGTKNYRRSLVLYGRNILEYRSIFKGILLERLPHFCTQLGMEPVEADDIEIQLTSHNDGDYYLWHKDKGTGRQERRVLTFVYYFNFEPKMFTGGELVLHPAGVKPVVVSPDNNTMILFDSCLLHEVKQVNCPSQAFEHGRFTLNGWILNKKQATEESKDAPAIEL